MENRRRDYSMKSEEIHLKTSYRNLKNILENHLVSLVSQRHAERDGFYETGTEND